MPDLNVLILEDVEADAELMLHELERSGYTVTAVRVETEKDYLAQLERGPDIILADYSLPQFDGRGALQLLLERHLDIPFIVVTSTISEEVAVDCIKLGAADYLLKDRLTRLGPAVGRAFAERDVLVEKRRADVALRESEGRFREVVEAAPDGLLGVDPDGKIILANTQIEKMFGYSRKELLGQPVEMLIPLRLRSGHAGHRSRYAADPYVRPMGQGLELAALRKDGREFPVEISLGPLAAGSGLQVLATVRDLTERKRIERALHEAEADYRSLFENAVEGIYRSTPDGRFLSVNAALARMHGYDSPGQLRDEVTNIGTQLWVDASRRAELARILEEEGVVRAFEAQMRCRDGSRIWVSISARAILDSEGNATSYEGMIEDITERVELRDQVLRSQKMEAIGRLAGGIAHDFNNMLTIITGHTAMLQSEAGSDENHRQHLDAIQRAAGRSAGLTRQLLAFGRKQIMQPAVLNLNTVVSELDQMLRRIIGEDIRLQTSLDAALRNVKVDSSRIEQVMMNLVINSRDAMPEGGRLTIETLNVELGRNYVRSHHDVEPGFYVMLAVSDTGIGMDSATQSRIFEPFFTTKGPEKGTGLGLSTVYGIVKQSGGHIWVYSEPGHGTTFKIYLPGIDQPADVLPEPAAPPSTAGTETILLVEDEESVRKLARMILEMNGYKVLEAVDVAEALSIAEKRAEPIDLLLTDVVMPGASGRTVADQCLSFHPEMRALFMSGYTDNAIAHRGILDPATNFIEKPFTPGALLRKIREVLG